jgi:fucose permease
MNNNIQGAQPEVVPARQTNRAANLSLRIGLSYYAFILIGASDGAFGVLLPSLRAHYNADKATISLLFLFGTLGYLTTAAISGLLTHKLGLRRFLALGPLAILLGAALAASMPPFALLMLAMFTIGLGDAVIDAGLNSYFAGLPRNSALLNYLHAFYGVGALIGPLVASGFLAAHLGWNTVYMLWVVLSLVALVGFVVLFADSHTQAPETPTTSSWASPNSDRLPTTGNVLTTALRLRAVWLAASFLLVYVGAEVSLGGWSYSFLTEERHEPELLSGWVVSGFWMGLTLGRLLLGGLALRLGNNRLIQICLVGVVAGMLLVWLLPVTAAEITGLWLAGFSLGPIFPTTIALMSQLVPSRLLPSAIGLVASLGSMGAALFPWIAGNLAHLAGLWVLMPYVVALAVLMQLLWLALQAQGRALPAETEA